MLNDDGTGSASAAIRGLEYLRKLNDASQAIRVDGVNMSLGYPFDPKSYGCGYSPLCQEVTRAVESGLIVVISCGNWGYGKTTMGTGEQAAVTVVSSIRILPTPKPPSPWARFTRASRIGMGFLIFPRKARLPTGA